MDLKKMIRSLGMIACIIILCTVIVKLTVPNETLLDYANENPELAYPSPEASATDPSSGAENLTSIEKVNGNKADRESTSDTEDTNTEVTNVEDTNIENPNGNMTDVSSSKNPTNTTNSASSVTAVDLSLIHI